MKRLPRRILGSLALMLVTTPVLPTALAEIKTAGAPTDAKPWLHWAITLVIAGACGVIMFMNAKRSHQS